MVNPNSANSNNFRNFDFYNYVKNNYKNHSAFIHEAIEPKNNFIYEACTKSKYIYEVVQGAVKLGSYTQDGSPYIYDVIGQGNFFGNYEFLNDGQFYEYSKTLLDCRLRRYNLNFFKSTVLTNPIVSEWFISYLVSRWVNAEKKIRMANEKGALEKLKYLKYYFNYQVNDCFGEEYLLFELLTQKDLGDLVGATRQTIANTLQKIEINCF
ncbi:Crp/Fnr family transcriptional regulator [Joostella sp. CR20]|uniref:Crp/Fnr family transcriptional regulator n=1 Tax=Joostella sp. CR20 TaxID=2804312 RepID=UPI00313DA80E